MKNYLMVAAGLLVFLTGCSGESDSSSAGSSQTPSEVTTTAAAKTALDDACPEVAAALEGIDFPTEEQLRAVHETIAELAKGADLETQNALGIFALDIEDAQAAYDDPDNLTPALEASERFDEGIASMNKRCEEVGSSAFSS